MKLHFLGQAYFASNNRVETVASDYTARFLGQNYTIRRPVQTFKSQLRIRKYRGVFYGADTNSLNKRYGLNEYSL